MIGPHELPPDKLSDILLVQSRDRGEHLSNLKLQKLLYYTQAWHLALYDRPLFGEDFQAWVHGPALVSQYHRFKDNGWRPILNTIYGPPRTGVGYLDRHIGQILDIFGVEPATALEMMTHRETPWIEARRGLSPDAPSNRRISKETMKKFYRGLAQKNQ
jgi:uncharacterized phage-associated protein